VNPPVPPLPYPDDPPVSEFRQGNLPFRRKAFIGFVLIFAFLIWNNLFAKQPPERKAKNQRARIYVDALTDTKAVLLMQEQGKRALEESRIQQRREREALEGWQKLANSPRASASDWRRLGLVQFAFKKPNDALTSLQRAAELSVEPRPLEERDDYEVNSPIPAKSSEAERRLWHALYSDEPLGPNHAAEFRAQLSTLRLGWFEHLAAQQLFLKIHDVSNATAAKEAALQSCRRVDFFASLRSWLFAGGVLSLILFGVNAYARKNAYAGENGNSAEIPRMDLPLSSALPNPFGYRARISAFLAYLVVPIATMIPFAVIRGAASNASPHILHRINLCLYFITAFGAVWLALSVLRRATWQEGSDQNNGTLWVLKRLGLHGRQPLKNVLHGILGYAVALVAVLIAGIISKILFSQFETPSHPVLRQLMTLQAPWDRMLIFVQAALVAAITEEILFRGILYPAFRERYGIWRGMLLTSALFALAHPTLPGGFLPLMTLGMAFNIVYEQRSSLIPCITMHALHNGLLTLSEFALLSS
jgi:membrane protease YdiL (CAAX protease family)